MTDDGESPNERVEEWTFQGRRIGSQGQVVYAWLTGAAPHGAVYKKPLVRNASVGSVYEVTNTDTGYYTDGAKGPRYLRRADVPPEVMAQWRGQDLAAGSERDRKSAITKASREHPLEEWLAPLRTAAVGMTRSERRALACDIFQALGL
jgi:hypothetical protein